MFIAYELCQQFDTALMYVDAFFVSMYIRTYMYADTQVNVCNAACTCNVAPKIGDAAATYIRMYICICKHLLRIPQIAVQNSAALYMCHASKGVYVFLLKARVRLGCISVTHFSQKSAAKGLTLLD